MFNFTRELKRGLPQCHALFSMELKHPKVSMAEVIEGTTVTAFAKRAACVRSSIAHCVVAVVAQRFVNTA